MRSPHADPRRETSILLVGPSRQARAILRELHACVDGRFSATWVQGTKEACEFLRIGVVDVVVLQGDSSLRAVADIRACAPAVAVVLIDDERSRGVSHASHVEHEGVVRLSRRNLDAGGITQACNLALERRRIASRSVAVMRDLENFLTFASLNLHVAARLEARGECVAHIIEDLQGEVRHMRELLGQPSPVATSDLNCSSVKLGELANERARRVLRGSGVTHSSLSGSTSSIRGDRSLLALVVDNLLLNRCQSLPQGAHIFVSTRNIDVTPATPLGRLTPGPYVVLRIRDTGAGRPSFVRERLIDPHFTTRSRESGVGLAACLSIILRHGGDIIVKARRGAGTLFDVYLPALPEQPA